MTLPRAHRGFFVFSLLATALALGIAALAPPGGRLLLGGVAAALVLVAGLRGARRSALGRRLGSAAGQLRAHLWLGGLSLVFALAHGGGRLGGPLSTALVLTLAAVVVCGICGVALQRALTRELYALSAETIFDLERGTISLRRRAFEAVWAACGAPPEVPDEREALRQLAGAGPRTPAALVPAGSAAGQDELLRCYRELVLPYLRAGGRGSSPLTTAAEATLIFEALEARLADPLRPALQELRQGCARLRAARRQHRLHRWLHGWLLVHAPLSVALLVLLCTHAVLALRY